MIKNERLYGNHSFPIESFYVFLLSIKLFDQYFPIVF